MSRTPLLPGWLLAASCALAVLASLALGRGGDARAEPAPSRVAGTSPWPGGGDVPLRYMPPGTHASPIPSDEIFPPQQLTIRFHHKKHVQELKLECRTCHGAALTSRSVADRLLPAPAVCDGCHDVDHQDLSAVRAGSGPDGQCGYCHLGEGAGVGGRVAPLVLPRANLRFSHKDHLDRNIGCAQCHGKVEELELATRDQLPRMAGCFTCHAMTGASAGGARSTCDTCHLTVAGGRLQTVFATGPLLPPRWLHGAAHGPDWIERHRTVAGSDSAFCGSCHTEEYCAGCHDGKVRPRRVHPNDWMSMHPQAARQDNPRCTSCHQLQTFCADCHRRVGVARDAPAATRQLAGRFHPPPSVWTMAPRTAQHHAWEAQRNLNACVSCHSERDCTTCHAARGVAGGAGVNPHPAGFAAVCSGPLARNPRPCLACHEQGSASLERCR